MSFFTCEVKGLDIVKAMIRNIGEEMAPANVRTVLNEAGNVVIREAKRRTSYKGLIGQYYKSDLASYRDRRSSKKAEYIIVGPRFREYNLKGGAQKVAVVAQHITKGFRQTDRKTRSGFRRGRVRDQVNNPVLDAFNGTEAQRNGAINKGVNKYLNKVKRRYASVVR